MPSIDSDIVRFLALRRIALIGVSRREKHFTRTVAQAFLDRGYDVAFVHPAAGELLGHRTFATIAEVTPPVEGAVLMTPANVTPLVARACAQAEVPMLWMYRGAGQGAVDAAAVSDCRARGMTVIAGACPFMFWPKATFVHRLHGVFSRRRVVRRACAQTREAPNTSAAPPSAQP